MSKEQKPPTTDEINDSKKNENTTWWAIPMLFFILLGILNLFSRTCNKSTLARSYKVKVKILMKWVRLFCPAYLSDHYVGQNNQKINVRLVAINLGNPRDYPTDTRGRIINKRRLLAWSFGIGEDTLKRTIKEIPNPKETIGMHLADYNTLRYFPPRQSQLLVNYLASKYSPKRVANHCLPKVGNPD